MPGRKPAGYVRLLGIGFLAALIVAGIGIEAKYGIVFARVFQQPAEPAPKSGSPAPDFELSALDGGVHKLSDHLGKPVFINFWATWCKPCILEMPNLQKYYEQYGDQFEILAINAGESEWDVSQFVKDMGLSFPVILDQQSKIAVLYKVQGFPTTYIISSDGIIQGVHIGMLSEKKIGEYLESVGVMK
jgi:thiol-disulfide isomerase/thioredoxin